MPLPEIRARLAGLIADIDAEIAATAPTQVILARTESLPARVAASDGRTTFVLPRDYVFENATIDLAKPCTVIGADPVDGIAGAGLQGPTLRGMVRLLAPGITLSALRVQGASLLRHGPMLVAADRATLSQVLLDGGTDGMRRGVLLNGTTGVTIDRSSIVNCFHSEDAQAVVGWDRVRDVTIRQSLLEASGENVMFGGGDPADEAGIPQGITLTEVVCRKPLAWRGKAGVTIKNLLELKNAKRFKATRCLFAGCWGGQGQTGYGIVLTVRNQDGTAPYSTIEDVLFEDCTVTDVASGVQVLGRDDTHASGRMARVSFVGNHFTRILPQVYGGAGHQVYVSAGPDALRLERNQFDGTGLNSFLYFDGPQYKATGLIVRDNEAQEGEYGIFGDSAPGLGKAVLDMYAPGHEFTGNRLHRGPSGRSIAYPAGTQVLG